jgi:hypothetical protein
VAPVKFVPVITTDEPTHPLIGEKLVMLGAAAKVPVIAISSIPAPIVLLVPATVNLTKTCVPLYELKSIGV